MKREKGEGGASEDKEGSRKKDMRRKGRMGGRIFDGKKRERGK